jgi:putative flippase GtrA
MKETILKLLVVGLLGGIIYIGIPLLLALFITNVYILAPVALTYGIVLTALFNHDK